MALRRIWLCADDYGIAPGVNDAIRELILRRRLNATSVMVGAPHFTAEEAAALDELNAGEKRAALGLHVSLTAPFAPLSAEFAPSINGKFLPLNRMMRVAIARRLDPARLTIEIATQVEAFIEAFGRPPDFIDGHQHVHLFPQIRDAVLKVAAETAPQAWLRQCGRARSAPRGGAKQLFLDVLSIAFRRKARALGVATNPAFSGAYDFGGKRAFATVFARFLEGLPDGGLVMCHPGHVDTELKRLDPVTQQREREFAFFSSDEFPKLLIARGLALAAA